MAEDDNDPIDENERLADADVAEGRLVPHALVREWLKTLGTPDQAAARLRLRNVLVEGATSPPSDPVGPEYFEALRNHVRGE
ncbi:hypothetical protein ASD79_04190 [Caulobacter sp. Root655]|nr:hypothetical protein ASD79_04190 [Caulobacter sp. Root655]